MNGNKTEHFPSTLIVVRYVLICAFMILIWAILIMVYFDHSVVPFDRIQSILMPWKAPITDSAELGLINRLTLMKDQLAASKRIANLSFIIMTVCFAIFSAYLGLVYQQKQRRLRENRLLQVKNQEIARRNEFIRYISATIGHEFKNNLARIKRRFDLQSNMDEVSRKSIYGNFDKLFSDIDIFKKIADEREAGLISFEDVNLKHLLEEISVNYGEFAEISFQNTIEEPVIFASVPLLKTVFENILDNAVKYKKNSQAIASLTISISLDSDDVRRYVALSFKDNGIGMDEQQADQCFYKGSSTGDGWGEGMYYSKYVVGLHAGKIRVGKEYTEPDVGTEILIHLPYVKEAISV